MKDIKNTTQKKYRDYSKTPGSPDNDFLFMYSVARQVYIVYIFMFIITGLSYWSMNFYFVCCHLFKEQINVFNIGLTYGQFSS